MKVIKGHLETPQRTFFFERGDGSVIALQEREAWSMIKYPAKSMGQGIIQTKFIGSSEGKIYRDAVVAARVRFDENGGVYDDVCRKILLDAEQAEIALARGQMVYPRNFDMVGQRGSPIDLNSLR